MDQNVPLQFSRTSSAIPVITVTHEHDELALNEYCQREAASNCAYLLPHLDRLVASKANLRILDVGCEQGFITVELAKRYPEATIVGVDEFGAMEATERARVLAKGVNATNVFFYTGNIHHLIRQYGTNAFDVVHAHRMLQHCGEPVLALKQMRGVAKPGGIVAVRTADLSQVKFQPKDNLGLRRWKELWLAAAPVHRGDMRAGWWHKNWARKAGFEVDTDERNEIKTGPQTWATGEDRQAFARSLAFAMLAEPWKSSVLTSKLSTMSELATITERIREWGSAAEGFLELPNGEMVLHV